MTEPTLTDVLADEQHANNLPALAMDDEEIQALPLEDGIKVCVAARGLHSAKEIKDVVGYSQSHTRETAQEMAADGELVCERDGRGYKFTMPTADPAQQTLDVDEELADEELAHLLEAADADGVDELVDTVDDALEAASYEGDGRMPVFRGYDWDQWLLDGEDVTEYIPTDGEADEIEALIETRDVTGQLPHFALIGPSGTAKTMLAKNIAHDRDAPYFEVQCGEGLRVADLLGSPTVTTNEDGSTETWWADQTVTKALLASQEQEVVLCLDEVSRAPPRALGLLFGMLDHRCSVQLPAPIAGENPVQGDPSNLIVVSTMNKGTKNGTYHVNDIDDAQWRRLGRAYEVQFLGQHDKDREVALVAGQTPASTALAEKMVEVANTIREQASERRSAFEFDLGPALVIEWARTAWGLKDTGEDPVVRAAQRTFITPYCAGDDTAEGAVREIVEDKFGGLNTLAEPEVRDHFGMPAGVAGDPDEVVDCVNCGYVEPVDNAPEDVLALGTCPDCNAELDRYDFDASDAEQASDELGELFS